MSTPNIMTSGFPGARALRWPKKLNLDQLDAGENAAFLRELEHISKELLETKYAVLKGRQHVPTLNEGIGVGEQSFTYRMWDYTGVAKPMVDMSADLMNVNIQGAEATQRLQAYGVAYTYSVEEIEALARLGRPLDADRAMVAKKVLDQKLDSIIADGDTVTGLKGFNSLSGTRTYTPATKAAGGLTWAVATPNEILADLNGAVTDIKVATKEVESPTRILLPTLQFAQITTTARSTVSDTTIKEFFEANNPGIEIMSWERLSAAGSGGTARMIVYEPNVQKIKLLMPLEFAQLPPQPRNFAFVNNCWFKTGGVISPYPQSISFADGI